MLGSIRRKEAAATNWRPLAAPLLLVAIAVGAQLATVGGQHREPVPAAGTGTATPTTTDPLVQPEDQQSNFGLRKYLLRFMAYTNRVLFNLYIMAFCVLVLFIFGQTGWFDLFAVSAIIAFEQIVGPNVAALTDHMFRFSI